MPFTHDAILVLFFLLTKSTVTKTNSFNNLRFLHILSLKEDTGSSSNFSTMSKMSRTFLINKKCYYFLYTL